MRSNREPALVFFLERCSKLSSYKQRLLLPSGNISVYASSFILFSFQPQSGVAFNCLAFYCFDVLPLLVGCLHEIVSVDLL